LPVRKILATPPPGVRPGLNELIPAHDVFQFLSKSRPSKTSNPSRMNMKKLLLTLPLLLAGSHLAWADIVYVTARPSPSGANANTDGTYAEIAAIGADTSAAGTGTGVPARSGCRYFSNSFSNTAYATSYPLPGISLTPTLGVPGGVYQIHHNFSSTAANVSTNISLTVTCSVGGTLSFTTAGTNFTRAAGNPANQWKFLGYLTNDVGSVNPTIDFYYLDGHVNAGLNNRLLVDAFRFTYYEACVDVPVVSVTGPLSSNSTDVVVTGISASATNVFVYQDSGAGMVQVGAKLTGVTAGNNTVTVSSLTRGAVVAATQKINGQEGCVPTAGLVVGGGANPSVRMALSVRETPSTGPIGSPGNSTYTNIHFLNATATSGGAPIDAGVIYPSNGWQTVTFFRGTNATVADVGSATGTTVDGFGYNANDTVSVQAYAYKVLPNGTTIYSATPATSSDVTSNDVFTVNWTWSAVTGADGYRLLRSYNFGGYNEFVDVLANNYADASSGWTFGTTVTPTNSQSGRSIKWSSGTGDPYPVGTTNYIPGQWGIFEAIAIAIDSTEDTGPFDLYIDNLQNGATTFQTFETAPAGTGDYGFRAPNFSGSTANNLLAAPNVGSVVNNVADTGSKSFRVRFQWSGTNSTRWLRLTTSGVNNPQINLDEPISFRLLMQPVNATLPTPPPAPTLSVTQFGPKTVLNWADGHRLQTSVNAAGTYTNVPQVLSANTWTNVNLGAFLGPWTNNYPEPTRFFRLRD
jgi:3D (Asp-Asp-Asp) domain-containing protein